MYDSLIIKCDQVAEMQADMNEEHEHPLNRLRQTSKEKEDDWGKYGSKGDKSREEESEDKKESKDEDYEDVKEAVDEDGEDIKTTKEDDDNKSSGEKVKDKKSGRKVDKGKLLKGLLRVLDRNLR